MELHNYFRSSASYRVRIALAYKGLSYDYVPVHLVRDGGAQHSEDYKALNPEALVPALVDDGKVITQSLAMLEYLEERHPTPALLPADPADRAWVRALSDLVACEIHPINNLRVLQYLEKTLGVTPAQKMAWIHHWILLGFASLEAHLARDPRTGSCCVGDTPSFADLCLVPQVFNARRFNVPLDDFPTLVRIDAHLQQLDAFRAAAPGAQPDAE
ncbi:maleylacetoacetate isomerase [Variovorax ginsengisoli]|uniref:Maleylacetoacetate isomerase n=1 Tax=Variovorax ginsengisoli TaxID=363844 RepID=A0ABT9S8C4_9BURK|nr:maleylacetoacetate isomerase [Variovorax ginsengisoli]MDP9900599.1 maleylacetoacetate isomerase [Variovorax ginsengisoli]